MNSLIASALLFQPRKEITFKNIKTITKSIYNYIKEKDYKTYVSICPQNYDIKQAVLNLGFKVSGDPLDKKIGD